jgi:hypothetical protein
LREGPVIAQNHIQEQINALGDALTNGSPDDRYLAAVALSGIMLRYADENRPRHPAHATHVHNKENS